MMIDKILLLILLIGWHVLATIHFGSNFLPQSDNEFIVDGIAILGLIQLALSGSRK